MPESLIPFSSVEFIGDRFSGHSLDVDCVAELQAYKQLILECAKELWRRNHQDRDRLPKGYEQGFALRFSEIRSGSAVVPLVRVLTEPALVFPDTPLDEFDEAARLIDATIQAAGNDSALPTELPRSVIPLFRNFGSSLQESESIGVRSRTSATTADYSASARTRLVEWTDSTYLDIVDVVGEVSMANVRAGAFELIVQPDLARIGGRFSQEQEEEVLEALRNHRSVWLHVSGTAEFSTVDRQMKKFARIDEIALASGQLVTYDESVAPVWEQLAAIGRSAPEGTWDDVPDDLSMRIDEVAYGDSGNKH